MGQPGIPGDLFPLNEAFFLSCFYGKIHFSILEQAFNYLRFFFNMQRIM